VPIDLLVKIINQGAQARLDERSESMHALGILITPANVSLKFLVSFIEALWDHDAFRGPIAYG
jgi:hypothetical protein